MFWEHEVASSSLAAPTCSHRGSRPSVCLYPEERRGLIKRKKSLFYILSRAVEEKKETKNLKELSYYMDGLPGFTQVKLPRIVQDGY